ncbi:hypothetical protein Taro_044008 [Colocasia esculenta]|uniref:Uncharacterized protein n=1 Tax=Colocasia esculenta TaxID=4460 RepID=A0A843WX76_COLES|nr:hypothetical protein [Colocasia esculenta]
MDTIHVAVTGSGATAEPADPVRFVLKFAAAQAAAFLTRPVSRPRPSWYRVKSVGVVVKGEKLTFPQ